MIGLLLLLIYEEKKYEFGLRGVLYIVYISIKKKVWVCTEERKKKKKKNFVVMMFELKE